MIQNRADVSAMVERRRPPARCTARSTCCAVAAAGYMAKLETRRTKLVTSRGLHPHSRAALRTHAAGYGMTVEEVPLTTEGATDLVGVPVPAE